ncbi:SDR family oxidoreductase [Actinoallomurus acanthiterrae]
MTNRYQALFDLTGRTALVMGAASGIGEASARTLAGLGAAVVCADVDGAGAKETAERIVAEGGSATGVTADLTDREQVVAAVDGTVAAHGRLDIGVTTPGINIRKRVAAFSDEEFDRIIDLNLKGTFFFLQRASAVMAAQGSGSLVACSSMRALMVEPGLAVYAATKAAILQMAYDGHTVFGRWGTADEVGSAVAFLASDAASYVTGTNLVVDAGWTVIDGRFDPGR